MSEPDYAAEVADWPELNGDQKEVLRGLLGRPTVRRGESPPKAPMQPRRERVALYRYYDDAGVLLYIGISNDVRRRDSAHEKHSSFGRFVKKQVSEWFGDRLAAEESERQAIRAERPLFNVRDSSDPDRDSRLTQYLIEREAYDLLTPIRQLTRAGGETP